MDLPGRIRIASFLSLLVLAACGAAGEGPDGEGEEAAVARAATTQAALPVLFDIMTGLEEDMARIRHGIWAERLDAIAAGAEGIASHRRIAADEIKVIRGVLGDELIRFNALDREVHDLAVRLRQEAEAGELEAVLTTETELRDACVRCHTEFRGRLRAGVTEARTPGR